MNLNTGRAINARKLASLPVTDLVIHTVKATAERDGIECLKFENKEGIPIHPNDWIAGVDHDHPQHHDNWLKNQEEEEELSEDDKDNTHTHTLR